MREGSCAFTVTVSQQLQAEAVYLNSSCYHHQFFSPKLTRFPVSDTITSRSPPHEDVSGLGQPRGQVHRRQVGPAFLRLQLITDPEGTEQNPQTAGSHQTSAELTALSNSVFYDCLKVGKNSEYFSVLILAFKEKNAKLKRWTGRPERCPWICGSCHPAQGGKHPVHTQKETQMLQNCRLTHAHSVLKTLHMLIRAPGLSTERQEQHSARPNSPGLAGTFQRRGSCP